MLDRSDVIKMIRRESLDLPTKRYKEILDEFVLLSYSCSQLERVSTSRLFDLLRTIKQAVNGA